MKDNIKLHKFFLLATMFLASNCTCAVYFTYTAHVQLLAKNMAATHRHVICIHNQTNTLGCQNLIKITVRHLKWCCTYSYAGVGMKVSPLKPTHAFFSLIAFISSILKCGILVLPISLLGKIT